MAVNQLPARGDLRRARSRPSGRASRRSQQDVLGYARVNGITVIIAESPYVIHRIYPAALAQGLDIPADLSLVGLGDHGDRQNVLSPDPA
jgi:hypothetical protein